MEEIARRFGEYMETAREIVVSIESDMCNIGFTMKPEAVYNNDDKLRVNGEEGAVLEITKDKYEVSYEELYNLYILNDESVRIELEFI